MSENPSKDEFLYPIGRYHGQFSPGNLAFNANLQEFAQRVAVICGLETGGKISSQQAYTEIKNLWHQLKESKKNFLDEELPPPPPEETPDQ